MPPPSAAGRALVKALQTTCPFPLYEYRPITGVVVTEEEPCRLTPELLAAHLSAFKGLDEEGGRCPGCGIPMAWHDSEGFVL
jgi:hypothetical protein